MNSSNQNSSGQQFLLQPTSLIKNKIKTIQNTVDELQNKKQRNNGSSIESLIKYTTPQSNIKNKEFVFQSSRNPQKIEYDKIQSSTKSQNIVQFQIDELNMKNQTIMSLTSRINNLEKELKFVNNQISESNLNFQISQKSLTVKDQELKDLIKKNEQLQELTNQAIYQKDQYQDCYKSVKNDHELLKIKFNDLQKTNQSILKESDILKKTTNDKIVQSQLQMKKEEQKLQKEEQKIQMEEQKLQKELLDKNKVIRQLSEDGKILGQQLKDISYKIQQIPSDLIPENLQILQRELYLNECLVNSKLNNMHLAQIDLVKFNNHHNQDKKSRKFMNCHNQLIDQMKSFQVHSDIMAMMIIQSEIIEKFMN